jgi:transcription antitermination factor NusG
MTNFHSVDSRNIYIAVALGQRSFAINLPQSKKGGCVTLVCGPSQPRGPNMGNAVCCSLPLPDGVERAQELEIIEEKVPRWYAVFTMSRHEKQIAWHFDQREIESFLPLYKTKHRWKNRCAVDLELPLFPNYVFVRIDAQERLRVLKVPSVVSIVSTGREPVPVPDHYIVGLQNAILTSGIEPHQGLDVGDKVRITAGAMAGMVGVLDRQKSAFRVVLRLEMIGRSVAVEVDLSDIEPADSAPSFRRNTSSRVTPAITLPTPGSHRGMVSSTPSMSSLPNTTRIPVGPKTSGRKNT